MVPSPSPYFSSSPALTRRPRPPLQFSFGNRYVYPLVSINFCGSSVNGLPENSYKLDMGTVPLPSGKDFGASKPSLAASHSWLLDVKNAHGNLLYLYGSSSGFSQGELLGCCRAFMGTSSWFSVLVKSLGVCH
uniref:Uncharacterized protein n=1 Tax=Fagus sylvatica TaxID=28930 RepID=A0A2N9FFV0_FAGSY